MRNKKGFTLIELLAVIVILSIILVIATTNVLKTINQSKDKARFIAAKEIVGITSTYMEVYCDDRKCTHSSGKVRNSDGTLKDNTCINVKNLVGSYLENDVTNPANGENIRNSNELNNQKVCVKSSQAEQSDYEIKSGNRYNFDGYYYQLN